MICLKKRPIQDVIFVHYMIIPPRFVFFAKFKTRRRSLKFIQICITHSLNCFFCKDSMSEVTTNRGTARIADKSKQPFRSASSTRFGSEKPGQYRGNGRNASEISESGFFRDHLLTTYLAQVTHTAHIHGFNMNTPNENRVVLYFPSFTTKAPGEFSIHPDTS